MPMGSGAITPHHLPKNLKNKLMTSHKELASSPAFQAWMQNFNNDNQVSSMKNALLRVGWGACVVRVEG